MCPIVVGLYDALVYTGVGTFFGARERMNEIVGTIAEPRIKRRTSLRAPSTTAVRSKNIISAYSRDESMVRKDE
jgi:hypothetical protein